jgi:hypothetical protein
MASNPSGTGYWLVASDGGIFGFGHVGFYGSTGNVRLDQPVVGMAPTASGRGYWLVAADGGVFDFGDATFHGSGVGMTGASRVVGLVPTSNDDGYWIVLSNGSVLNFGDAAPMAGAVPPPAPPVATASSGYTLELTNSAGTPIRWNSCEVVPYAVVSAGAPAGWASDVANAVAQVSSATGLSFQDDGDYPSLGQVPASAKVTISWSSTIVGGDAIGLTTFFYILDPRYTPQITAAHIQLLTALVGGGGPDGELPVLLHELGHAVGLGHYPARDVMNPVDQGYSTYQPGDLAGLARVGAAQGCAGFYS